MSETAAPQSNSEQERPYIPSSISVEPSAYGLHVEDGHIIPLVEVEAEGPSLDVILVDDTLIIANGLSNKAPSLENPYTKRTCSSAALRAAGIITEKLEPPKQLRLFEGLYTYKGDLRWPKRWPKR